MMSISPQRKIFAGVAITLLMVPTAFMFQPPRAHAYLPTIDVGAIFGIILNFVENTIVAALNNIVSSATDSLHIKEYVLDGIAWAVSQSAIQSIAGSALKFVTGGGRGGSPLIVTSILNHYQQVGDNQALAFFGQLSTQFSNDPSSPNYSPFAGAVTSSLRANYSRGTSLSGFFKQYQCTLTKFSPNVDQYLKGDFTQGGWGAWFSLTTQPENNPFTLQQATWNQTVGLVNDSKNAQSQQLSWNQGLLSWCGSDDSGGSGDGSGSPSGPSPQCTNSDGTEGRIQTPGTFLVAESNKVLGAGVDKLIASDEIDETLGQIAVQFVTGALIGPGGLLAAGQPSADGRPALVDSYTGDSVTSGGGNALIQQTIGYAQNELQVVQRYIAAWTTISTAATTASNKVNTLINAFQGAATTTRACQTSLQNAQFALSSEIQPVISRAQSEIQTAQRTGDLALRFLDEVTAPLGTSTPPSSNTSSSSNSNAVQDAQALTSASPTESDLPQAEADARTFAQVSPNDQAPTSGSQSQPKPNSLTVSGGSIVDQMNLISTNATTALNQCFASSTSPFGP